jgi:hypothetical protein
VKRTTDTRLRAWILLGVALVLAMSLWVLGTRPIVEEGGRVFGGGTGTFSRNEAHTNWLLVGVAIAMGVAGTVGWAALLLRHGRNAARVVVVATVTLGVIAAGSWGVTDRLRADDPATAAGPSYATVAEVVAALEGSNVECNRLVIETNTTRYFRAEQGVCEIERRLALDDGLETVSIQFWRSSDARAEWYENLSAADVVSVDGPTWLITCEFETTCSQIQIATGGRTR